MGLFRSRFSLGSYDSFHVIAFPHGRQSICIMVEGAKIFQGGSVAELVLVLEENGKTVNESSKRIHVYRKQQIPFDLILKL